MTDPKIKIGADASGVGAEIQRELLKVQSAAQKVNDTLASGEVGINLKEAKADLASLVKDAQGLASALNKAKGADLGNQFEKAEEGLKEATKAAEGLEAVLDAVGQSTGMAASVKGARDLVGAINQAVKAQGSLGKAGIKATKDQAQALNDAFEKLKKSGARGTSFIRNMSMDEFYGGGSDNYSIHPSENRRYRNSITKKIMSDAGTNIPSEGHDIPGRPGSGRLGAMLRRFGGIAGGVGAGVLSGGGLGIGAAAGGLAGAIPGAGMILGPIAGALGGAIDQSIQRVIEESIDLTDLRHSLGSTKVDFDELQGSVRHFVDGLGVTYGEAAKLAREFGHLSGLANARQLGMEVGQATAFGRGYGLDPTQTTQFFAMMRMYGASGGPGDSKRLALQIGEAVSRGGMSSKMDEALGAIQNYVQGQSRQSFTAANTEAFASYMSSLTGMSAPGLKGDPASAAALMGSVDSALRQGGALGTASQTFTLGMLQRKLPGFNALDMGFINDQGAFGSVERAFGRNSNAYAMANGATRRKYDGYVAAAGDQTMLSMQLDALRRQYGSNPQALIAATSGHLGVNYDGASALLRAKPGDLDNLQSRLGKAGVDLSKISTSQIAGLAALQNGSDADIQRQAGRLRTMGLSKGDEAALNRDTGDKLKDTVVRLTSIYDIQKDAGEMAREQRAKMINTLDDLSKQLLPFFEMIKGAVIAMVEKLAPDSKFAKTQRAPEEIANLKAEEQRLRANWRMYDKAGNVAARDTYGRMLDSNLREQNAWRRLLPKKEDDGSGTGTSLLGANAGGVGIAPSGPNKGKNNPGAIFGSDWTKKQPGYVSGGANEVATFDSAASGSAALRALLKSYGKRGFNTPTSMFRRYAPDGHGNNNSAVYAQNVARKLGIGVNDVMDTNDPKVLSALANAITGQEGIGKYVEHDAKVPASKAGTGGGHGGTMKIQNEHVITIQHPDGRPHTGARVQTRSGPPVPVGMVTGAVRG